MSNFIPGDEARTIYKESGGNDDSSGLTNTFAKVTWASACSAAAALVPAQGDNVTLVSNGSATDDELITLPDYTNLKAGSVELATTTKTLLLDITGDELIADIGQVINRNTSVATAIRINGTNGTSIKSAFTQVNSVGGTGILFTGDINSCDFDFTQMLTLDDNATCIDWNTSTNFGQNILRGGLMIVLGSNTTGFNYNPSTSSLLASMIGCMIETGSGGTGIDVQNGELILSIGELDFTNAINVADGNTLTIIAPKIRGTITVGTGATLNIQCPDYGDISDVTNNGTINGTITTSAGNFTYGDVTINDDLTVNGSFDASIPLDIVETSINYTALITDDVVVGDAAITLTFPLLANADKAIVFKNDGVVSITLDGNGSSFEGSATLAASVARKFIPAAAGWVEIT